MKSYHQKSKRFSASSALEDLQHRLQYRFKNINLLQQALTHRSFSQDHYERLEFLGDAALSLSMSALLFEQLSNVPEGDLSRVRAKLVCEQSLHALAQDLGLGTLLRLGAGEARAGGALRPSILADAVEAILGAIYLDGGFEAASSVVRQLFAHIPITPDLIAAAKDAKTQLQEILHAKKMPSPEYSIISTQGAEHKQVFEVACFVPSLRLGTKGTGRNRRSAEQAAAAAMLPLLDKTGV